MRIILRTFGILLFTACGSTSKSGSSGATGATDKSQLLKSGRYKLLAASVTSADATGDYVLGAGAYYLDVSYDTTAGAYKITKSGIQTAVGGGYPLTIGCAGSITEQVVLDPKTSIVQFGKSSTLSNTCPEGSSASASVTLLVETYTMQGASLQDVRVGLIGGEQGTYTYIFSPVN